MKKYIFSVLMAAMAAFTFSSCEDVPEPYTQPTKPDAPTTTEGRQRVQVLLPTHSTALQLSTIARPWRQAWSLTKRSISRAR